MKLLILTTYPIDIYELDISKCTDKYQIITCIVYKYLTQNHKDDITITIKQCIPKGTDSSFYQLLLKYENTYPDVDHILFIDNMAFYSRITNMKKILEKTTSGLITSIGSTNINMGAEDILFYTCPSSLSCRQNTINIGYVSDPTIYTSKQNTQELYFCLDSTINNSISKQVVDFASNNSTLLNSNIIVKRLFNQGCELINFDGTCQIMSCSNYVDIIDEYSKINIFFVTGQNIDYQLLVDLAMCNVLIVSHEQYLNKTIANSLSAITYIGNKIPWTTIISQLNTHNSRDYLIKNNMTWESATDKIYDTFKNHNISTSISISVQKNIEDQPKSILRYTVNNNQKELKNVKLPYLLQNKLSMINKV